MGLTAAAYIGTVRFDFVGDDQSQIIGNPFIQFWRHVPKYFIGQVWVPSFPQQVGHNYRPLFLLWLRLNNACFGLNPRGWHAAAMGLHLLCTLLVYLLFRRMTQKSGVAAMGALIFGVHPIHAEVVAWVSGATESLLAVFLLAAFLCYLKSREGNSAIWLGISCILFGLAVFSKESGIVFPALVFAYAWIYGPPRGVGDEASSAVSAPIPPQPFAMRFLRAFAVTLPYWPVALFYLFARILVLHDLGCTTVHLSWRSVVFTMPAMVAFYIKKWFLPIRLAQFYDTFYYSGWNFWHVLLPALSVAIVVLVLWLARRRLGSREVSFASIWIIVSLVPVLDASALPLNEIVHDRYFYLPSVGAALLVALAMDWLMRPYETAAPAKATLVPVFMLTFVAFGGTLASLTAHEASFWMDEITLSGRAHTLAPRNPVARNEYGAGLISQGDDAAARAVFQEAIAADPNDWAPDLYLGSISYQERNYPEAERWFRQSIALDDAVAAGYLDLGLVQLRTNRVPESLVSMRRAAELRPYDPSYLLAYGVVLAQTSDCVSARKEFREALEIRPGDGMTQFALDRCEQIAPHR